MSQVNRFLDTSVGSKFLSISHADLTSVFQSAVPQASIVQNTSKTGAGLVLTLKLTDATVDVPELGGLLTPQLWMRTANDATCALQIGVGAFRFVCANGLFIGLPGMIQKIRHVDGPKANNFIDEIGEKIRIAAEMATDGTLIDAGLEALDTPVADPIDVIGSLPNVSYRVKDAAIHAIVMERTRPQDRVETAWGLYQLVNETAKHHSRSAYRNAINDTNLLGDITALADAQRKAA